MNGPNMEDVARAAGVHRTTVSRALKNDPRLAPATRESVRQIAKDMGYRSNPLVSALMAQRRGRGGGTEIGTIAYVDAMPVDQAHPISRAFHQGAQHWTELAGYRFAPFVLDGRSMKASRLSKILQTRGIRGVCIAPLRSARAHLNLDWDEISASAVGYTMIRPTLNRAVSNSFHGILASLRELRRLGYRRIGLCVDARVNQRVDEYWASGFLLFQRNHPKLRLSLFVEKGLTQKSFEKWYRKERPEVVISDSYGFENVLKHCGLDVPGDVGFVTLARSPEAPYQAGIDQHLDRIGAAAIDLIIGQLHRNESGLPAYPKTTMIEGSWVSGSTVRPLEHKF